MSGEQRIKGQETEALIVVDGKVQSTITDVRSLEIGIKLEILTEGYLGETTDRKDEIYKGTSGKIEFHYENKDIFDLIQKLVDRARRQTPGTKVNIKTTLNFPNGQRPRIMLQDVYFGEIPLGFASRSDYGTMSLTFEASDFKVL